ncbi:MAG TPA: Hsp20/alpha crystallin family protein [Ramlibacter sp.]|uniref:Hsp20/alpha crystallin family protein n=1 Tax=Ramlibacter sp. TaxID=1917967 RepID=UPI002BF1B7EE|nr:Hsp20/alpha crystallin family protein [Ramlibacter sp.]HVZ42938.1 Hsp20/alpha crystallin family protein [Ramlibacter sp.]
MSMFFAPALRSRSYSPALRGFDRGFERFLNDAFFTPAYSSVKFTQDDAAYTATLDLPGVARDELVVNIEGAVVSIETAAAAKRQFKGSYELPEEIDAESATAKLENGVLVLVLPKAKPVSKARKIEVR